MDLILLALSAIFVNNILLAQYLGNCPFCGVSKHIGTALGMGGAVIFVATLSSILTWAAYYYILKKQSPVIYNSLGIFLPLITTNCAVMGIALLNIKNEFGFLQTIVFSFSSALGFALALILFAGVRERLLISPVPKAMKGTSIALFTAGIMSLAFLGFAGIV